MTGPGTWRAGRQNAQWLATECRTARPTHVLQELGEEEDGFITDDGEGLRIWVGDDAFELERTDP